ncbi:hypothetical protein CIPAW_04G031700 [Carya illinoinensis]|uniref:Uncharacterized protein n=1 Tax=Carya illinoinensis TaxID=32201 RepID=A0A8T1QQQ7_CARIL|nr:hypothetical protein CIPAW_04G031700 [Carya illinoinensis]
MIIIMSGRVGGRFLLTEDREHNRTCPREDCV